MNEEHLQVESRTEWRAWLMKHHERSRGLWLVTFKKASGKPYVPGADTVEEALCFGWIDSKPGKMDALRTKLWFAPRKSGTGWSKVNKDRIQRLHANGLIHESGLRKIHEAQQDGSWSKLDGVEALEIPADLAAAFLTQPGSAENFAAFPRSAKRGILEWILQAKKPETRAGRINQTAILAAKNERANQWPK
jgi:uncharacterized protein YdeI (YjbR/CyaY-like superfamily)